MYLNKIQLKNESDKCLGCKNPQCELKCPLHLSAKTFIQLYKESKYKELINYMYSVNPFTEICGFVCPNKFCMMNCMRKKIDNSVNIKGLQSTFAHQYKHLLNMALQNNGKRVAVIGGGVAGLTSAWYLSYKGYKVDVFEKDDKLGGELNLIPSFRLPKEVLDNELELFLNNSNINVLYNTEINDYETLLNDYEYVIVAIGKQFYNNLNIENENYLTDYDVFLSNMKSYDKVAVIGGGNVAVDCALSCKTESNDVTMFVRRNFYDMKIDEEHLQKLFNKNINIVNNFVPTNVYKDEKLHLEGKMFDKSYISFNNYDVIVKAIGSQQLLNKIDNNKIIYLPISTTVVETIARTKEVLNNIDF